LLIQYKVVSNPLDQLVIHQRSTSVIEGDFVVFLIGARFGHNPFDGANKLVGEPFGEMIKELNQDSESGYLGGDLYGSLESSKSSTLMVQYWRSYEQLRHYAQSSLQKHLKAWQQYAKLPDEQQRLAGIWHETYLVRDGEYEAIYVHMPPIGLGLATRNLTPAIGKMRNSAGRVKGKDKLSSWPTEVEEVIKGLKDNY